MGEPMKINSYFNENGKPFQEIIEQYIIFYYNETLVK